MPFAAKPALHVHDDELTALKLLDGHAVHTAAWLPLYWLAEHAVHG